MLPKESCHCTIMSTKLLMFVICTLIVTVRSSVDHIDLPKFDGHLSFEPADLKMASTDFGLTTHSTPLAVLFPANTQDVASLVKAAYNSSHGFSVSARGHGHSVNGQSLLSNGVVVDMARRLGLKMQPPVPRVYKDKMYVDVWGGELWVDVLNDTLEYGLAPKSWTDYLYLSVGGTLSNAGISGQAFNYGPQISNVLELEVVTGKGEIMTCSETENSELFHAVLGGLGQFGIITRARIALENAPQRVRWIQVLYSSFSTFTRDQEYLISLHGKPSNEKFDYVEGFLTMNDEGRTNIWRSSLFSSYDNPIKISSVVAKKSLIYCLEATKNYNELNAHTVDQEIESLLKSLNFIPSSIVTTDVLYVDFLERVHKFELEQRSKRSWDVPHPWLNLLVPKSGISEFNKGVFKVILANSTIDGRILVYPMNKIKWDERTSAVIPDEDIFYLVAFLTAALNNGDETESLDYLTNQNRQILSYCDDTGIRVKQYLPFHTTEEGWMDHFGDKWDKFCGMKMEFDPQRILATGQGIFKPSFSSSSPGIASW